MIIDNIIMTPFSFQTKAILFLILYFKIGGFFRCAMTVDYSGDSKY